MPSLAVSIYSRNNVATLVPLADKFSRPTQLLFTDTGASNTVGYMELFTNPGTYYVVNQAVVAMQTSNTHQPITQARIHTVLLRQFLMHLLQQIAMLKI
jgi:hypothetical protein